MNLRFFRQFHRGFDAAESLHLPHVGQRILKTTLAVFLCLLIYALRGFEGQDMPTEAAITAIICMQPYVQEAKTYALNRAVGTLIGAVWGLLLFLLLTVCPALGQNRVVLYALMAAGVLAALYSTVLVRMPTAASPASEHKAETVPHKVLPIAPSSIESCFRLRSFHHELDGSRHCLCRIE